VGLHSAGASVSTVAGERQEATATAPDGTRAVVLLIRSGMIVGRVAGRVPLNIADAAPWTPNRRAVEARYPWLAQMMGTDQLISLALDIMRM
jgi:hypothetical protein